MKLWLWATVLSDDSAGVRWIPSLRLSEFSSDGDDDSNVRDMAPVGQQSKKMKDWGEIRLFFETCGKAGYPKDIQECLENVQLRQYLRWLFVNDHRQDYWLTAEEMGEANEINVSLLEFALSKSINFDWRHEESEENWRALIGLFRQEVPEWMIKGEEIVKGFDLLVENFGYKNAYRYLSRKDLSKHDALFAMEPIILMFKKSGLSKKQFWGNVLNQIVKDGAVYSEGCAQQHINQIATGTELDLNRVAREAKKYNMPEMNELLKKYSNYAAIFESWPSLRRYADLVSLLGETDALAMLETLGEEKKELSEYVKTLLFHKDSKVSIPAVTEFLNNPDMFLGTDDEHAPKEFHGRKKPSRYSHIPNLDMSGADLRDSLVEGTMDKIQGFTPMRIRYEIPIELIDSEEINTLETNEKMLERFKLIMAKGREDKEARSLFERVETIIGKQNMNGFFEGTFLASEDQWKRIREDHLRISFSGKTVEIEVQVHRKSDPMAAIAGDDTANCMPFGSGKNTVYTFNTNTGLMTVRLKVGDRWKTIAESVLTRDIEVEGLKGKSKQTFIWELETNGDRLDLALPEEVLNDGKKVIPILDNIEVAGGYKVPKWQKTIKALYSDFWSEYLNKNGVNLTNEGKIRAGLGYDDLEGLYDGQETTRWIPRAMVSYSDALGPNLGVIKTRNALAEYRKEITGEEQSKTTQTEISERGKRNGVRYAAVDDALAVGWLESRVYNESGAGEFVEGGAAMENMLIATQINNIRRGRPQMSLVHIGEKDEKKEMDGYLMAYEGKLYEGNSEMIRHTTNGVLYIEDMAVRQEAKIGAGAMLAEFMELYKKNYLEKNILMPIYMQARESTSFALVQKQLEKIAVSLGLKIQVIGDTEVTGSDNERHSILLVPQY